MHFRHKNSYWGTCVFLFAVPVSVYAQNVTCRLLLWRVCLKKINEKKKITICGWSPGTTLHVTSWHIHMALHTYVAVCPCLFYSTQMWMFSWGWQHSCIVLVFLFNDTLWSPFLKFALDAILCKLGNITESSIMKWGIVHIIICNPIGKKKLRSCTRTTFIADEQGGWDVSGGYWCKMIIPMSWLREKMFLKTLLLCMYMDGIKFQICWKFLFWCGVIIKLKSSG